MPLQNTPQEEQPPSPPPEPPSPPQSRTLTAGNTSSTSALIADRLLHVLDCSTALPLQIWPLGLIMNVRLMGTPTSRYETTSVSRLPKPA